MQTELRVHNGRPRTPRSRRAESSHPRPYARLEGIPHIEHSIPLDGINYSSRILTRGERDPDLTLEVARFADSPVR